MIHEKDDQNEKVSAGEEQDTNDTKKQEQSDPQLTELRGLVDPSEDLEPSLEDGKKSPDKAGENESSRV